MPFDFFSENAMSLISQHGTISLQLCSPIQKRAGRGYTLQIRINHADRTHSAQYIQNFFEKEKRLSQKTGSNRVIFSENI